MCLNKRRHVHCQNNHREAVIHCHFRWWGQTSDIRYFMGTETNHMNSFRGQTWANVLELLLTFPLCLSEAFSHFLSWTVRRYILTLAEVMTVLCVKPTCNSWLCWQKWWQNKRWKIGDINFSSLINNLHSTEIRFALQKYKGTDLLQVYI